MALQKVCQFEFTQNYRKNKRLRSVAAAAASVSKRTEPTDQKPCRDHQNQVNGCPEKAAMVFMHHFRT
jgi:hypothetical protein